MPTPSLDVLLVGSFYELANETIEANRNAETD